MLLLTSFLMGCGDLLWLNVLSLCYSLNWPMTSQEGDGYSVAIVSRVTE